MHTKGKPKVNSKFPLYSKSPKGSCCGQTIGVYIVPQQSHCCSLQYSTMYSDSPKMGGNCHNNVLRNSKTPSISITTTAHKAVGGAVVHDVLWLLVDVQLLALHTILQSATMANGYSSEYGIVAKNKVIKVLQCGYYTIVGMNGGLGRWSQYAGCWVLGARGFS